MLALMSPQVIRSVWGRRREEKLSEPGENRTLLEEQRETIETISLAISDTPAGEARGKARGTDELSEARRKEDSLMSCSPFRRRRREELGERKLTREEAWHLYLAKLEEEANYFSVSESSEQTQLCTCPACISSYEALYENYLSNSNMEDERSKEKEGEGEGGNTAMVMQAILQETDKRTCTVM